MNISILQKYFAGTASREEQEKVLDYFKDQNIDPENEKVLQQWWLQFETDEKKDQLSENILKKIHSRLDEDTQTTTHSFLRSNWLKIAASLLIIFSVVLYFYNSGIVPDEKTKIVNTITKEAPLGAKLQFKLPDGSYIYLNSGSKLTYPAVFDVTSRQVGLEGEAYFEVAKDARRPFIVKSEDVETKVLGTSFNISTFDPENIIVSLNSGSIQVSYRSDSTDNTILKPGEQFTYHRSSESALVSSFEKERINAWKNGLLIFDDCNLNEIVRKLQRWYGVEIQVDGMENVSQTAWKYSGEFDNESLENVLEGISYVKGLQYKIEGKQVFIKM